MVNTDLIVIDENPKTAHSNNTARFLGEMKIMKNKKMIRHAVLLLAVLVLLSATALPVGAARGQRLEVLVGGIPFGVRFFTEGILVVGYCDVESGGGCHNPARAAGLCPGDCIYKINEEMPHSAAELSEIVQHSAGELTVCYRREGAEHCTTLCPLPCDEDGKLRLGLFVRDSGAGIGTVTFVIGGSYGLSDRVKSAAHLRFSFGPATFPHQLARVMLCEQIYRAETILNNLPYHK